MTFAKSNQRAVKQLTPGPAVHLSNSTTIQAIFEGFKNELIFFSSKQVPKNFARFENGRGKLYYYQFNKITQKRNKTQTASLIRIIYKSVTRKCAHSYRAETHGKTLFSINFHIMTITRQW